MDIAEKTRRNGCASSMIKTTVTGADEAMAELNRLISEFETDLMVTVGIHEDENNRGDELTNASLGAIHEYGVDENDVRIPARPWLNPGVNSAIDDYLDIVRDVIDNDGMLLDALERIGPVAVSNAQIYMIQLKNPRNADSTIKRKKSSNPLIDTGELKSSVGFKIESIPDDNS